MVYPLRLLRLRLLRLPPTEVTLGQPFKIILSVTDDLGEHFPAYTDVNLRIDVVDASNGLPLDGIRATASSGKNAGFSISSHGGTYHDLEVTIQSSSKTSKGLLPKPANVKLLIRAASADPRASKVKGSEIANEDDLLDFIGEGVSGIEGTFNGEERYVLMRLCSGEFLLRKGGVTSKAEGNKVKTCSRVFNLPTAAELDPVAKERRQAISIIERPGLTIGTHLWDCALLLSTHLLHHPALLLPPTAAGVDHPRPNDIKVIELGSGCGMVGLVAAYILTNLGGSSEVLCTDLEETLEFSLAENIEENRESIVGTRNGVAISAEALGWGTLEIAEVTRLRNIGSHSVEGRIESCPVDGAPVGGLFPPLTILASDVLYNPSSHQLLLDTLASLMSTSSPPSSQSPSTSTESDPSGSHSPTAKKRRKLSTTTSPSSPSHAQALIAYKPRTPGDANFFPLATAAGFKVEKVPVGTKLALASLSCFGSTADEGERAEDDGMGDFGQAGIWRLTVDPHCG